MPRPPKISTSKFQGYWTQWQRVWKHQHSPLLRYLSAFSQNTFLLRKWLSFNPSTRIEVTSIPLHKTWQMNLLWLMDPPGTRAEMPCIPLHKFGRWTYFGWTQWQRFVSSSIHCFWDTCQHFLKTHFCLESGFLSFLVPQERWLAYHYRKLGRWTYFGWWTPWYQSRDALHTTT